MLDYELSGHTKDMLKERKIDEQWVWRTIQTGQKKKSNDGNIHFIKAIKERDGRVLRVIVNPYVNPKRIVTVFFDRRLTK